jgi:two-component system LytT family sensor kinase
MAEANLIGDGAPGTVVQPARAALDGSVVPVDSSWMERSPRRVGLLPVFGVATAFGIFSGLQAFNYVSIFTERKQPLHVLLALNLTYWYAWAVLMPFMVWMARRYRFGRNTWKRAAGMHAIAVVVSIAVHAALSTGARVVILDLLADRGENWWAEFQELFFLNFDWEMMTYWAVVGLVHAVDFHRESQERELTAAQLETRLAEAQLQALQRQLHPHFLFNTLHTISALMHRDTEAADAMLARLSDLLRLTLDRIGTQDVTLKEELDFIEKYLEIEQTRFGDRLQVRFDAAPATLDAAVPNLLLQPLVENAVRHGIGPKVGGGRVEIVSRREGQMLHLIVRDTGYGLPADKLNALNTGGVGLSNTRSRLETLYPGRHRFEFHPSPEGGVEVSVVIPFAVHRSGGGRMEIVA